MVRVQTLSRIALIAGATAATGMFGWWLGSIYGNRRVERAHAETEAIWAQMQAGGIKDVAVGLKFPSFPMWSADGCTGVNDAHELLPMGGVLVSISPTCYVCLDVAQAFQEASERMGEGLCPTSLLVQGEVTDALLATLREQGIHLPVFADPQGTLVRVHKVTNNPTYFVLDPDGVVLYSGFGLRNADELTKVVFTHCSPAVGHNVRKGGVYQ